MPTSHKISTRFRIPDESPGFMLWQVTNAWQRKMRTALKGTGLTHVQFVLLASTMWLNDYGNKTTQVAIARFAHVDVMMTSQVLRYLKEKKLVQRLNDPRDTRSHLITITEKGRILIEKSIKVVEDADGTFFAVLNNNTNEFTKMLRKLISSN